MTVVFLGLAVLLLAFSIFQVSRLIRPTSRRLLWLPGFYWSPWMFLIAALVLLIVLDVYELALAISYPSPGFSAFTISSLLSLFLATFLAVGSFFLAPHFLSLLKTSEEAQRNKEIYQAVFESVPMPLVVKDGDSNYRFANSAFIQMVGKAINDVVGKSDVDFFPRSQAHQFLQDDSIILEQGSPLTRDVEVHNKDGKRWLRFIRTPYRTPNGYLGGVLVAAQDISDLKCELEPLRQSEQFYSMLCDAAAELLNPSADKDLSQLILNWAGKLTGTRHGVFCLAASDYSALEIKAGLGAFSEMVHSRIRPGEELAGRVWQAGQALLVENVQNEAKALSRKQASFLGQEYSRAIGIPLNDGSRTMGVICLFQLNGESGSLVSDPYLLSHFSRVVTLGMEASRQFKSQQQTAADNKQFVNSLQFQLRLERLIATAATHLINLSPEKTDERIKQTLQMIGRYTAVSRCYLVTFPRKGAVSGMVFEWCADGVPPRGESLKRMDESSFTGWLAKLNRLETIYISNVNELSLEESDLAQFLKSQDVKSLTAVPLMFGRELIGFLGLETIRVETRWSDEVIRLLKIAGQMFVNAIEQKHLALEQERTEKTTQDRLALLDRTNQENILITELGNLLQSARTADEAYPIIARYLRRLLPDVSGALYMIRNVEDPAESVASWGEKPPGSSEHEVPLNECWGIRRGKLYLITDTASSPVCAHLHAPIPEAYVCAPLIAQGETVGLLHLRLDHPDTPGQEKHIVAPQVNLREKEELITRVTDHIAPALSNLNLRDKLRSMAIRDPLTGLFNRRYMEETLDRELRRATRHNTTVCIIMFDVDRMKPINDTLGHDAGDYLLRSLGGLLLRTYRGEDVACRYGGDEFTIILPEASLADGWQRAEQMREAFKRMNLEHEGKALGPVTLSIGVAIFPDHGASVDRLLQASDSAAYMAKTEGGDRVMIARSMEE